MLRWASNATRTYRELVDAGQKDAHHIIQDAAYGSVVPRQNGMYVNLDGNAFTDIGTPHYNAHASMEEF